MVDKMGWFERTLGPRRRQGLLIVLAIFCVFAYGGLVLGDEPDPSVAYVCPDPQYIELGVGETAVVPIMVTNAHDLYSIQLELSYDSHLIDIGDADPTMPGKQATLGTVFSDLGWTVTTNVIDSVNGSVILVASRVNTDNWFDGDGSLLLVSLQGIATGVSPLTVTEVIFSDPFGVSLPVDACEAMVIVGDAPTPTPSPTATHTPTATPSPTATSTPPSGPGGPITVRMEPDYRMVAVGMTTTMSIMIEGAADLYGAEVHITFDPTVLTVVDMDPGTAGDQISVGTMPYPDYVGSNIVDPVAGTIVLAISQIEPRPPAAGDGVMGVITFRALAVGISPVTITSVNLSDSEALPLSSTTLDGTVEVLGGGILIGQVTFQGRPAPPDSTWVCPLSVTLSYPGDPYPSLVFGSTADAFGVFTVPLVLTDTFDVRVRDLHSLLNVRRDVPIYWSVPAIDLGELSEGDGNADNTVDVSDLVILANAYDAVPGDPSWDPRADFNNDGLIGVSDLVLLAANYDMSGDHVVTAAMPLGMWAVREHSETLPVIAKERAPDASF